MDSKLKNFGEKLGIDVPPEIGQLGSNEAISGALVELAVGMGKSEIEIGQALGEWWELSRFKNKIFSTKTIFKIKN